MISDLIRISDMNLKALDLTPFDEPIQVKVEPWAIGGYVAKCKVRINYRWATECEYLETNRIFGHKGNPTEAELKKEFIRAVADIQEKRLWVFQANHGLLDKENVIVRFKK